MERHEAHKLIETVVDNLNPIITEIFWIQGLELAAARDRIVLEIAEQIDKEKE